MGNRADDADIFTFVIGVFIIGFFVMACGVV